LFGDHRLDRLAGQPDRPALIHPALHTGAAQREPLGARAHAQRLMRALGVVLHHPLESRLQPSVKNSARIVL
jgi:hypothetical protein